MSSSTTTKTSDPKPNSSSSTPSISTANPQNPPKGNQPNANKQPKPTTTTIPPNNSNNNKTKNKSTPSPQAPYLTTGSLLAHLSTLSLLPILHASHSLGGPPAALATALSARLGINNLLEEIITSLRAGTYSTDEALDVLRRGALGTAGEMQDGKGRAAVLGVVEGVAREVGRVRVGRGREWEGVVRGVVGGGGGGGKEVGREVGLARLGALVVGVVGDVLGRNPGLGPVREGAVKALGDGALAREREIERTARVNLVVRHKSVGG